MAAADARDPGGGGVAAGGRIRNRRRDRDGLPRRFLDAVADLNVRREAQKEPPLLPFKLHQFIAQTGSAYVTLEEPADRFVTLEPGRFHTDESGRTLPLFPVVFSRVSGHEMLCVRRTSEGTVVPRDFDDRMRTDDEDEEDVLGGDGYLVLEHDGVPLWTQDDIENLPASWRTKDGTRVKADRQGKVPQPVSFDPDGTFSDDPDELPVRGWWLPLSFRIDPTSGTFYPAQTGDFTKVARLGSEARSTSTSVLAYATSRALAEVGAGPTERKLLSFVDNRQDASLQSGHFNDFLRVVQLRGAVYAAAKAAEGGLDASVLGSRVADALGLPEFGLCPPAARVRRVRGRPQPEPGDVRSLPVLPRAPRPPAVVADRAPEPGAVRAAPDRVP